MPHSMRGLTGTLACVLFASSCGGGGSSDSTDVSSSPPPLESGVQYENINGIDVPVPPESSLPTDIAGQDANGNGVRDDVERSLARAIGSDLTKYQTAINLAVALQRGLRNDASDAEENKQGLAAESFAQQCIKAAYGASEAYLINRFIYLKTLNTKPRMERRIQQETIAGDMEAEDVPPADCSGIGGGGAI